MNPDILRLFPAKQHEFWKGLASEKCEIQEIRLRVGRPVLVRCPEGEHYLNEKGRLTDCAEFGHCMSETDLEDILQNLCHDSLYAFADELKQGFLTVPGGHRVGIAGQVVLEGDETIRTIKHICYMNIRIARQFYGVADGILPQVYEDGEPRNVLIISPPGCGKTTLLRELIRQFSEGNSYGKGVNVGVVDERSELAGSYLGHPQNDLGSRTDVLDACPKALGMMLLLRSMAPRVIAVDELGGREDMKAVWTAAACGSHILATVHGKTAEEVVRKFPEIADFSIFDCVIILNKKGDHPHIQAVYCGEEARNALDRRTYDCRGVSGTGIMVSESVCGKDLLAEGNLSVDGVV